MNLESRVRELEQKLDEQAEQLAFALRYLRTDPQSSLGKSRIVLEKLVADLYRREMGEEPKKTLLGEILSQPAFAKRIERRILSRIHAVRDMANLGPHGEAVDETDAARVLGDLCEILDWYLLKYRSGAPTRRRLRAWMLAPVVGLVAAMLVAVLIVRRPTARAPIVRVPDDGALFSAAPIVLGWKHDGHPHEVELQAIAGGASIDRVAVPRELDYAEWPWRGPASPGEYRWRVRARGGTFSGWRELRFFPSVLDRVRADRRLRVGEETTFHAPFVFVDPASGEVTGFDVELAQELARRLGVKYERVPHEWNDLFAAVARRDVDMVISAVSITDERKQSYGFSTPYLDTGQRLVALRGHVVPTEPRVGFQEHTTAEAAVQALPHATPQGYPTLDAAFAALAAGEIDELVADDAIVQHRPEAGTLVPAGLLTRESYGILLPRGDAPIELAVDGALTELERTGWLDALKKKYRLEPSEPSGK